MDTMKAAVDADYRADETVAAAVLFREWTDEKPARELVARLGKPADYTPGELYRRELPGLLAVLEPVRAELELVIVDGYVWLDREQTRRGLGAHLFEALEERVPVIGVAKTLYKGSDFAAAVSRGTSSKPLYVTAAGLELARAAELVRQMHGPHRLPTLLKRVDRRARES